MGNINRNLYMQTEQYVTLWYGHFVFDLRDFAPFLIQENE